MRLFKRRDLLSLVLLAAAAPSRAAQDLKVAQQNDPDRRERPERPEGEGPPKLNEQGDPSEPDPPQKPERRLSDAQWFKRHEQELRIIIKALIKNDATVLRELDKRLANRTPKQRIDLMTAFIRRWVSR